MNRLPRLALSVRQPWAWAIIYGGKDIENRSWQAVNHGLRQRGEICIHASKGMTRGEYECARGTMADIGAACPRPDALLRGGVIGVVTVTDVVTASASPWFFGPRGLVLADARPLDEPFAGAGALGYFDWRASAREWGGSWDMAKPWMKAWQAERPVKRAPAALPPPAPMPLFGEGG